MAFAALVGLGLMTVSCSSDGADEESGTPFGLERDIGTDDAVMTTAETPSTTEAPSALANERGPYDVGVITLDLGDRDAEVWYPAANTDGETEFFDTLAVFPDSIRDAVPVELSGIVDTGAHRGAVPRVELSAPLVIYSHGLGEFRQVATGYATHLASWGYVVASTDHLERGVANSGSGTTVGVEGQDLLDVDATIDAVVADPMIGSIVDADSVVIAGHGEGAWTAALYAKNDIIDGYVSISGGAPETLAQKPALVVTGQFDSIVSPEKSRLLFDRLETAATFVEIAAAGHNSFVDFCRGVRDNGGLGSLTEVLGAEQTERYENGCVAPMVQPEASIAVLNHYTLAFLDALFDNALIDDGVEVLATDISGAISVVDFDIGSDGTVPVVLSEHARH